MRIIEGRIVSMVNGETIVCVATKQEYMEKKGDNTRVMKLFSIPTQTNEGMKTKVNILGFYTKTF